MLSEQGELQNFGNAIQEHDMPFPGIKRYVEIKYYPGR
jgi:hypothetical protein